MVTKKPVSVTLLSLFVLQEATRYKDQPQTTPSSRATIGLVGPSYGSDLPTWVISLVIVLGVVIPIVIIISVAVVSTKLQ